jgi:hypothetical protein
VAVLALKYRQNRNQRQRVVLFVGSPVDADEETLVKLGKKLKKNAVALDVVLFANLEVNEAKLTAMVTAANSGGNSNIVVVPPGPLALADVLISSAVFAGDDGGAMGTGFAAAAAAGAAAAVRQVGAAGAGGTPASWGSGWCSVYCAPASAPAPAPSPSLPAASTISAAGVSNRTTPSTAPPAGKPILAHSLSVAPTPKNKPPAVGRKRAKQQPPQPAPSRTTV